MARRNIVFYFASMAAILLGALWAQTPYYGPNSPAPGLIQVQLLVYDQPTENGLKIESVQFDGRNIALQPPDVYGFRGGGGFQMEPGNYQLQWVVSTGQSSWPRSVNYKKSIAIQRGDVWVQLTIKGDQVETI